MALEVLRAYLILERKMMSLDEQSDPAADRLRDLMDPLWHELDDEGREYLNSRSPDSLGGLAGDPLDGASIPETGHNYSDGELNVPLEDVLAA